MIAGVVVGDFNFLDFNKAFAEKVEEAEAWLFHSIERNTNHVLRQACPTFWARGPKDKFRQS